jgi:PAS domain S-box-containing protein
MVSSPRGTKAQLRFLDTAGDHRSPVTILIPPDRQGEEGIIDARVERGERIATYETMRRRKDGSLVPISLMVSPITNGNGAITGAWKIARGISRRGKQERI